MSLLACNYVCWPRSLRIETRKYRGRQDLGKHISMHAAGLAFPTDRYLASPTGYVAATSLPPACHRIPFHLLASVSARKLTNEGATGAEDKKTLIIMSHGACRDRRAWLRHTPFLLKAGYTCLSFDYSDHGTSDMTDGITAARGTTLGLRESRDVARVVRYAREHFTAYDLVLMGTSTGSVSSFIALATDEFVRDHTKCLVAECPFASIAAITWDSVMNVVCLGMLCKNNRLVFLAAWPVFFVVTSLVVVKTCLRLAGEGYFTTISCAQAARTCTTPTLLLHGMQDSIVPSKHSESIAEGAECIKDVWFLPGAGHCQVWDTDPHEFERRTLSFLAQFCD